MGEHEYVCTRRHTPPRRPRAPSSGRSPGPGRAPPTAKVESCTSTEAPAASSVTESVRPGVSGDDDLAPRSRRLHDLLRAHLPALRPRTRSPLLQPPEIGAGDDTERSGPFGVEEPRTASPPDTRPGRGDRGRREPPSASSPPPPGPSRELPPRPEAGSAVCPPDARRRAAARTDRRARRAAAARLCPAGSRS